MPNWADESNFHPMAAGPDILSEVGDLRAFTAMYTGSLGDVQGLNLVVEAADLLRQRADIGFVFVGSGVAEQSLRADVASKGLDNVRFLGMWPLDRMSEILALGDVQLVMLRDLPIFRRTLPSKVQSTLAAGRPIIGAVTGDAATIIDASGAGTTVPPGSAVELAEAIDRMSRMVMRDRARLGQTGRAYYERELGRDLGGAKLEHVLKEAANGRHP